jgi:hypothetical protein
MKTNWTKKVNEINHKRFTIPPGWETKEQVAESLECSPDKVADLLKPGIQSGDIDRQEFPVWDDKRRMAVKVVCYRVAGTPEPAAPTPSVTSVADIPAEKAVRIIACIGRNPGLSDRLIAKKMSSVRSSEVAAVRASL